MNIISKRFKFPKRQALASGALQVLFSAFAVAGFAAFLYGFWLFWRPGTFLFGGLLTLALGFLGLLGHAGSKHEPEEPF